MSTIQRCIPLDSPEEWNKALVGIRHTFGHTWENCYAMHLTTGLKTYLYSFQQDGVRIVCPFAEREFDGYVDIVKPFGFSGFVGNGESAEFPRRWREFVGERGYVCGYLGLNPLFDYSGHFDSSDIHEYDTVFVLNLTASIDQLLANMARGRRRQLNNWEKVNSNLVVDRSVLKEFFMKNYAGFLRSRNASSFYFFSDETLSYLLSLDNMALVGAEKAGKVVAAMAFTCSGDVSDALLSVSLPDGRSFLTALIWYAVNYLKARGVPNFNLGGGGGGIADYKRHFGCRELPLRCLKQVYRPDIYKMLCRKVNADPKDMEGYFPAYRGVAEPSFQTECRIGMGSRQ